MFTGDKPNLPKVADYYFRYLCALNSYPVMEAPEGLAYDLVVDFGDGFKRIQLKSTSQFNRNKEIFRLTRLRTNTVHTRCIKYGIDEIDYFFLYHANGRCWMVPIGAVVGKHNIAPSVSLRTYEIKIPPSLLSWATSTMVSAATS